MKAAPGIPAGPRWTVRYSKWASDYFIRSDFSLFVKESAHRASERGSAPFIINEKSPSNRMDRARALQ